MSAEGDHADEQAEPHVDDEVDARRRADVPAAPREPAER